MTKILGIHNGAPGATKYQYKFLTGDEPNNVTLTSMTFSGIVAGEEYEVFLYSKFSASGTDNADVRIIHDGVVKAKTQLRGETAGGITDSSCSAIFTATTTTITFTTNGLTTVILDGNGTLSETHAYIKRKGADEITTDYT